MTTKELLIRSAIAVLNEDPSSNLDVIAEKAGVSRRSLHRYFSSRENMIKACAQSIMQRMLADVKTSISLHNAPIDQLRKMFEDDIAKGQHYEFCQKFADQFAESDIQAQFKEMSALFYGVLDKLKSEHVIDIRLDNEWLAYVWMAIVRSTNQAVNDGVIAPRKANELGWNAFVSGVMSPRGSSV